jgi:hypothetical protein
VIKNYSQVEGLDFDEIFTPVAMFELIRILLIYATHYNFNLYQIDVNNVLLNGPIKDKVYVEQPSGFKDEKYPNYVYKPYKMFCGIKQAPRSWYK